MVRSRACRSFRRQSGVVVVPVSSSVRPRPLRRGTDVPGSHMFCPPILSTSEPGAPTPSGSDSAPGRDPGAGTTLGRGAGATHIGARSVAVWSRPIGGSDRAITPRRRRKGWSMTKYEEAVLGVDIGTSSAKGVLVALDGTILRTATREHTVERPAPGHVEMDARCGGRSSSGSRQSSPPAQMFASPGSACRGWVRAWCWPTTPGSPCAPRSSRGRHPRRAADPGAHRPLRRGRDPLPQRVRALLPGRRPEDPLGRRS